MRRGNFYDEDDYEPDVVAIAFGKRDRVKQDAIYVDLDKSCRVKNSPMDVTREEADAEYERVRRYRSTVTSHVDSVAYEGLEFQKLKEAMKIVFWQKHNSAAASECGWLGMNATSPIFEWPLGRVLVACRNLQQSREARAVRTKAALKINELQVIELPGGWSGRRESNPRMQLGKLPFYH
jgi:hypothetical protein